MEKILLGVLAIGALTFTSFENDSDENVSVEPNPDNSAGPFAITFSI